MKARLQKRKAELPCATAARQRHGNGNRRNRSDLETFVVKVDGARRQILPGKKVTSAALYFQLMLKDWGAVCSLLSQPYP